MFPAYVSDPIFCLESTISVLVVPSAEGTCTARAAVLAESAWEAVEFCSTLSRFFYLLLFLPKVLLPCDLFCVPEVATPSLPIVLAWMDNFTYVVPATGHARVLYQCMRQFVTLRCQGPRAARHVFRLRARCVRHPKRHVLACFITLYAWTMGLFRSRRTYCSGASPPSALFPSPSRAFLLLSVPHSACVGSSVASIVVQGRAPANFLLVCFCSDRIAHACMRRCLHLL